MTSSAIVAAVLLGTAPAPAAQPAGMYAYLKPSVAPVPADCKGAKAVAGLVQVPLFGDDSAACPVARVGDEVIRLIDLSEVLAASHESRDEAGTSEKTGADQKVGPALDRLIQARLILEEARTMGLGDLPEAREAYALYEGQLLRVALEAEVTKDVKADPAEVEKMYREAVREWKVRSVLFAKPADGKAFAAAAKTGDFDALTRKAVADKKGREGKADWIFARDAQPAIAKALRSAKAGFVSGAVVMPDGGAVVLRVDDVRFQDDPKARKIAGETSLARQQRLALERFYGELVKRYARVDAALLKKLDWEAKKPGYAALAKDPRAIATIQGEKPITVAELTKELTTTFFHGVDNPIKQKRVNKEKDTTFKKMLMERLFLKEARVRKLEDTPAVRRAAEDYRNAILFSLFVERVVAPGVKVTEADSMASYEKNKSKYSYPQMYKLEALDFATAKGAQSAVERLRGGTDFQWMRANAEGQVKPEERSLSLDVAEVLIASSLPAGLQKALAGASSGDYRIYAPSEKEFFVVRVVENIPPKAQPYAEVREAVANAVRDEKMKAAVKDYADKLRAAGNVEIYLARIGS